MKEYRQPNAELLLFAPDDIMVASDEFELAIDWFRTDDKTAPTGGSDQSAV